MIQAVMLVALGFLTATLIGVLLAPSLWSRAYRLSRQRLEKTLPLSLAEIEATQDQLRASYAVRMRRLETSLASAKQKAAMQLVDNSRLQMQIVALRDEVADIDLKLSERRNAAAVLEQTITKRFPELDREITGVKAQLQERSYELEDLANRLARREEELAGAQQSAAAFQDELARVRQALDKTGTDRTGRRLKRASQWTLDEYRSEYDRLNLELSRLRQQLTQLQDRDAQQVGLIKGELQKLAELILASAQPRAETVAAPERTEAAAKRGSASEVRRDRPLPWPPSARSSEPVAQRLPAAQMNASPSPPKAIQPNPKAETATPTTRNPALEPAPPTRPDASSKPVADAMPLSDAPTRREPAPPPPISEAKARILRGVTEKSPSSDAEPSTIDAGRAAPSERAVKSAWSGNTDNGAVPTTRDEGGATPSPSENREKAEGGKALSDARDLQSLSELIAMTASPPPRSEQTPPAPPGEPTVTKTLDLTAEPTRPEDRNGQVGQQHGRTLLDRLRGASEEQAKAGE